MDDGAKDAADSGLRVMTVKTSPVAVAGPSELVRSIKRGSTLSREWRLFVSIARDVSVLSSCASIRLSGMRPVEVFVNSCEYDVKMSHKDDKQAHTILANR